MRARYRIELTPRAAWEINEASDWWDANRPKAPDAFREELQKGFDLIGNQPNVGPWAQNVKLARVRRIHLSRIRYHLYYRFSPSSGVVTVLALWHTSRGSGPGL